MLSNSVFQPINFLDNGTATMCLPFGDEGERTTLVTLCSPDIDLFGIKIGDGVEQARSILEDKGYVFIRDYSGADGGGSAIQRNYLELNGIKQRP